MSFHCTVTSASMSSSTSTSAALRSTTSWGRTTAGGSSTSAPVARSSSSGLPSSVSRHRWVLPVPFLGRPTRRDALCPEIGSQWQAIGDAFAAGLEVSFHNDGSVTPPNVLLNIQGSVTRTTNSGTIHGANQKITLDQALRAVTINGARQLAIDDKVGSLEVGKQADLVELSMDPYAAAPLRVATQVSVLGTWVGGRRIDLETFEAEVAPWTQHRTGRWRSPISTPVVDEGRVGSAMGAKGTVTARGATTLPSASSWAVPFLVCSGRSRVLPKHRQHRVGGASRGLHMAGGTLALASSVATLSTAATVISTGLLADRLGRRRVLMVGLLIAALGDLMVALAPTTSTYLLGRAIAGVGLGAVFGAAFAYIRAVAKPESCRPPSYLLCGHRPHLARPHVRRRQSRRHRLALGVPGGSAMSLVCFVLVPLVLPKEARVVGTSTDALGQVSSSSGSSPSSTASASLVAA